ncbi:MAG: MGMT family protein [Actinomycetia bacterium]|nr:MGMT family protein [Actinomycetes bacterium]
MTEVDDLLAGIAVRPPADLERTTLITAGAADQVATTDSPFGLLWISWSPIGVTGVTPIFSCRTVDDFMEIHRRNTYVADRLPMDLASQVDEALEHGTTPEFPVDLRGIADFQGSVLQACRQIQPGTVRSYGWVADALSNPGAVRAVGTALGHNPIPLLIPCHRVVRSDGSIGNYAFGPEMKHDLLVAEGAILA